VVYKTINIGKILYESIRNSFAINKAGELSIFYKFCLACVYPLQTAFDSFETWRQRQLIIANCNYTIGQLKNVLNYLFDNTNFVAPDWGRITITQSEFSYIYAPTIDDESTTFAPPITDESTTDAPTIESDPNQRNVMFNIPSDLSASLADIIATIDQIKIDGLTYSYQLV
jgi:hypothetical protein